LRGCNYAGEHQQKDNRDRRKPEEKAGIFRYIRTKTTRIEQGANRKKGTQQSPEQKRETNKEITIAKCYRFNF
jgi:hypothetical protein